MVRWSLSVQRHPKSEYQTRASTAPRSTQCFVSQSLLPSVNITVSSPIRNERQILITLFVEYPSIKVFYVHPGSVKTDLYDEAAGFFPVNSTVELAASTIQYLTSGKADYLSGRYVSVQWDLGEVERDWKEKIIAQNGLVSKLSIPV